MATHGQDMASDFVFELSTSITGPLSVDHRDGQLILILRDGAVVDEAFVQALNDLTRGAD